MNLEDEECPYDAIYDLQGRAKPSMRKRKTCMAAANKSVGPASSSSTKNQKQPAQLKMILLENVDLEEKKDTGRIALKK